ncbi:hypothetical protein B566_EDAN010147 [Ephemera danica]|nr:hypothetical protein B566_EDAN010147 [Ephemera danica]
MDSDIIPDWDGQGPVDGKILRIATFQNPPLSGFVRFINGTYEGTGVAFEIVRLLERTLNFTHREADMVAALIPVRQQLQPEGIVYSTPVAVDEWIILMRRPEELASGTGLFAPFDTHVWLATLGALVAIGPVMYALLLLRRYLSRPSRSDPAEFPLSACVWFAYSAIMKQGSTLAPASDVSRLLFATWWMFITILTSFYTANLTAFLTLSRFTLPIEEARELAYDELRWIGQSGGALEHAITQPLCIFYKYICVLTGQVFLGERSTIERVMFRHYIRAARDGLDHAGRCSIVFTTKPFMIRPLAFAFPDNSSLPSIMNPVLRSLVEGGVMRHALRLDLPNREICPLNLGNSERQLRNADLFATYLAMCVGICTASVTFLCEFTWRRFKSRGKPQKLFVRASPRPPPNVSSERFFYPRDFTLPPVNKAALLMDPHLFIVHRALNVRITKPYKNRPRIIAFTE